ncbi:MAG: hypothetical protein QM541_05895 [Flavobacterium sp.]|nr:hypothetical protein [Flavobacterium sp.]
MKLNFLLLSFFILFISFKDLNQSIVLLDYKYEICKECSNSKNIAQCKNWTRKPKKEIQELMNTMKASNDMEVHDLYNTLPCVIRGKCIFKNDTSNFELNAGGYMWIFGKDTTFTFVYPRNGNFGVFFNIK